MTARKFFMCAAASVLMASAGKSGATCFSIYDAGDTLIYRSYLSPIDLSGSISAEMARRFPGDRLLITDDDPCQVFSPAPGGTFALYGNPVTVTAPTGSAMAPAPTLAANQ